MARTSPRVAIPNLGALRTQLRVNASELAREAKVSRSSVVKAEKGQPVELVVALRISDCLDSIATELGHSPNSPIRAEIREFNEMAVRMAVPGRDQVSTSEPRSLRQMKNSVSDFFERGHLQYLDDAQRSQLASFLEEFAHRLRKKADDDGKYRY